MAQSVRGVIVESLLDGRRHECLGECQGERPFGDFDVHRRRGHCAGRRFHPDLRPHGRQGGDQPKESPEKLKAAFAEVLPEYDRDRVHVSDIKKCFAWYNTLVGAGFTEFKLPAENE